MGSYCGKCRKTMPATRRGNPGEPQILPNGLRKLTKGELERLVTGVMRANPVPEHVGITGWTPGRIAIFLPGRSTGAIGNALDKLVTTGLAQLIGEAPKRYVPILESNDTQNLRDGDSQTSGPGSPEITVHQEGEVQGTEQPADGPDLTHQRPEQ